MLNSLVLGAVILSQSQRPVSITPLSTATLVTSYGATVNLSESFSLGGMILTNGIGCNPRTPTVKTSATYVYTIPKGAFSFRGIFGVRDEPNSETVSGTLSIYVDGDLVKEILTEANQKPTKFDIPLVDASSLKLVFENGGILGNGSFSSPLSGAEVKKPAAKTTTPQVQPEPEPKTGELGRVQLTEPEVGRSYTNKVKFAWQKVDGAVSYGVEVILIKNEDANKVPTRFMRAFPATKEAFEWLFTEDVVSGEYQVSVIAFGKKGVITKFSSPRRFKVARSN